MRIIGGKWRSRRISFPRSKRTRPMPDRIRESIFDILASHFGLPGALPPLKVADLFAGSGSMGWEAVSRGASGCDFIEKDFEAAAVLRDNARALAADASCRILRGDAWVMPLATPAPPQPYGLIFLDPPYADSADVSPVGRIGRLLSDLSRARWVDAATIVVLHHPARVDCTLDAASGWRIMDQRTYGTSRVTFLARQVPPVVDIQEASTAETPDQQTPLPKV